MSKEIGNEMNKMVMHNVVSVDGFIADANDDIGPLFERYFGSVDGQRLLEDPDVVIRGDRVLHLRYRVCR